MGRTIEEHCGDDACVVAFARIPSGVTAMQRPFARSPARPSYPHELSLSARPFTRVVVAGTLVFLAGSAGAGENLFPPPCDWLPHQEFALFPPVIGSHIRNMLSFPPVIGSHIRNLLSSPL
eukprot:1194699-Prorocentrum_minimum.AAC.3